MVVYVNLQQNPITRYTTYSMYPFHTIFCSECQTWGSLLRLGYHKKPLTVGYHLHHNLIKVLKDFLKFPWSHACHQPATQCCMHAISKDFPLVNCGCIHCCKQAIES